MLLLIYSTMTVIADSVPICFTIFIIPLLICIHTESNQIDAILLNLDAATFLIERVSGGKVSMSVSQVDAKLHIASHFYMKTDSIDKTIRAVKYYHDDQSGFACIICLLDMHIIATIYVRFVVAHNGLIFAIESFVAS